MRTLAYSIGWATACGLLLFATDASAAPPCPAGACFGFACSGSCWASLIGAILLSAAVGYIELLQRYSVGTDLLFFLSDSLARWFLLIHAFAGAVAWIVLPSLSEAAVANPGLHAAIAGLGALAILRLSFMNVGSGDKRVSIGPGALLDILVSNLDQRIDQNRASRSIQQVAEVVKDLDFERAARDLTAACAASMERLPEESGRKLAEEVAGIQQKMDTDAAKLITLGTVLRKYVGLEVLKTLVGVLQESLKPAAPGTAGARGREVADRAAEVMQQLRTKVTPALRGESPAPTPGPAAARTPPDNVPGAPPDDPSR
jgi:hypothetical protein